MIPPEAAESHAVSGSSAEPTADARANDASRATAAATRQSIEVARQHALEIDRALSELRASLRETGPSGPPSPAQAHRILDVEPAVAYRWLLLDGHEAFCRGRYEEALALFEDAAREAPRRVEGHLNAGRTLLRLRRVEAARGAFARALALEPGSAPAVAGLADCDWRAALPEVEEPAPKAPRHHHLRFLPATRRRAH